MNNTKQFTDILKSKPTLDLAQPEQAPPSMSKRFIQRMLKLFGVKKEGKGRTNTELLEHRQRRRTHHRNRGGGGGARPVPETKTKRVKRFIKIEKKAQAG